MPAEEEYYYEEPHYEEERVIFYARPYAGYYPQYEAAYWEPELYYMDHYEPVHYYEPEPYYYDEPSRGVSYDDWYDMPQGGYYDYGYY